MKVLFIPVWYPSEFSPLNGDFVFDSAAALHERGIEVAVIYPDVHFRPVVQRLKYLNFPKSLTTTNGFPEFRMKGIFFPKINKAILDKWAAFYETLFLDYVQKLGLPQLLHAHNYLAAYPAWKISCKYNIPYVITEHKSSLLYAQLSGWRAEIATLVYQHATKVIAVSHRLAESIKTYGNVESVVVYNMTDTDYFQPGNPDEKYPDFTFVAVGSLIPRKGIDLLLRAFQKFSAQAKHKVYLEIIGDGPERNQLEALARKLNVIDAVRFRGELPRPEVLKSLQRGHAFVHTARREAFGIVMIEAMATGLPVIAVNSGGPEDILSPETGILVNTDIAETAAAMDFVFSNQQHFSGKIIRDYAIKRFSRPVVIDNIIAIYKDCIA